MKTILWDEKVFFEQCANDFAFLVDLGFKEKPKKKIEGDVYTMTYVSRVAAIEITFDRREQLIDVILMRLANGKIPARYDVVDGKVVANLRDWFSIYDLLNIRASHLVAELIHGGRRLSPEDIRNILAKYSHTLSTWGRDVLQGNFSVFVEMQNAAASSQQALS